MAKTVGDDNMVKIFADSTCDLSEELVKRYDITVVPLHIVLDDREYLDGVEIGPDEIYAWADEHKATPKTSAVSMEDAMKSLECIDGSSDEAIVFTISEKMSVTSSVFRMAAQELGIEDKVTVIESANLSTGIGLLILTAADMAKAGKSRLVIYQKIEEMKGDVRSSFVVDTLTYLHRGGRCSGISAMAGGMLKLHPKIVVKDGRMAPTKKYRGRMEKVIIDYVEDMHDELLHARKVRVFITHSGCDQNVIDGVYNYLKDLSYFDEILITRAGGVISSHCGPGTLGVLFVQGI